MHTPWASLIINSVKRRSLSLSSTGAVFRCFGSLDRFIGASFGEIFRESVRRALLDLKMVFKTVIVDV